MAPSQVYIAVLGTGGVGAAFLSQLSSLASRLSSHPTSPTHLSLIYISRSSTCLLAPFNDPIPYRTWQSSLSASSTPPLSPESLISHLSQAPGPCILVDNTSSQPLSDSYPLFLRSGISIITPNKKPFSSTLPLWTSILSTSANNSGPASSSGYIFHESTVGAGLPILSTLTTLLSTGDSILKIEGVFSGTLSFLFNNFMPLSSGPRGGSFSAEVAKAKHLGYTEPDPRDDLNGLDVARKLTILARMAGLQIESPSSFPVQSLIPPELEDVSGGDEFLARLGEFDDRMETVKRRAQGKGKVLRFVGSVDVEKGEVEVGLREFEEAHPIAALKGSDNIVSFYTKRYGENPLIVQGAGAGAEVTAMGVTGDLIKVLSLLR